ncbi:DUF2075 domain-containing protein [Streptomyces sp. NBC_00028]|uniref:DNA/RNA helicase domain-containing protein n=1 Tax=Streptomyces sp. NBC_00028 TaxID=2975624 RepID=UPI00324520EA
MDGENTERELFEEALPLLRQLFGAGAERFGPPASRRAAEELVWQVVRWTPPLSEALFGGTPEVPELVSILANAVQALAGRRAAVGLRRLAPRELSHMLLTEVAPTGLPGPQEREMRRLLDAVCRLVLDFLEGADASDVDFERLYREHVEAEYGKTGLTVPVGEYYGRPLHLDYVRLSVEHPTADSGPSRRPLEEAVRHHRRLLLFGGAGAGKTTALRRLAVQAVRPGGAEPFDDPGLVPFYLPVRLLAQYERLPSPSDFLSLVDCPLTAPQGWAQGVLTEGRGLLLIDGMDEAPVGERARLRRWMGDLYRDHPRNRWIVTARPVAIPGGWLADLQFRDERLAPFSEADARSFVRGWYEAQRRVKLPRARSIAREASLLALLSERADLARLATNPLMCVVLCATYDDRRGGLPRARAELYMILVARLLRRRDEERFTPLPPAHGWSEEEQADHLGELAYWMIRNGQNTVAYDQARRVIDSAARRTTRAPDPNEVLTYHLTHSGVLRSPVEGAVDFAHVLFRDYLAARSLVANGDYGLLVEHAHDVQWRDVFLCAVGLASPQDRSSLLELVLERAGAARQREDALPLYLLAAAGLAEADDIDPQLADAIRASIEDHLPPRTAEEAAAFASLGSAVLDLLPNPDEVPTHQTGAFLNLLAHVPGPAAEAAARRFTRRPRRTTSRTFPQPAPGARRLAVALSIATRIEPELIRAVRLQMFPLLDAGDEADLWFSPWTAAQTPHAMALRTELLPALREELAARLAASAPDDPIQKLGSVVAQVHAHISPALGIEERLNWLDVTGALASQSGSSTADAELQPALRALVEEHREGIADWLAGAWPRLPESVRESTAAWQLLTAAVHRVPDIALEPRPAPPGVTAADVAVIVDAVGDAVLTVSRSGDTLTLGAGTATTQDAAILVPDTDPRVVEVLGEDTDDFRTVTVGPGEERSIRVGAGAVRLRTPRGDVYELMPTGAQGNAEEPGEQRDPQPRDGRYLHRTTADVLAQRVYEIATEVWQAESQKPGAGVPDSARLSELHGNYAALSDALLEAGLEDVEVILGELGAPGDEPADVTLGGHHPESGEVSYVCLEVRMWTNLHAHADEPRLVTLDGGSEAVHPMERARDRRTRLIATNVALEHRAVNVEAAVYLPNASLDSMTTISGELGSRDDRALFVSYLRSRLAPRPGADAADLLVSGARRRLPGVLETVAAGVLPPPFEPIGPQTIAVGRVMTALRRRWQQVFVVTGAAGTGKTAMALRIVAEARELGVTALHLSGTPAFRQSLREALGGVHLVVAPRELAAEAARLSRPSKPGVLVFDDGQSLRPGAVGSRSDRFRMDELMSTAVVSVFVLDEESTLSPGAVGTVALIREAAEARLLPVEVVALNASVRTGGSTAYPRWVSALLASDGNATSWTPDGRHTVLTADGPEEMETFLKARREQGGMTTRTTAGICWPLTSGSASGGVRVGKWRRPWWLPRHDALTETVGSAYDVHGYEFDWCGVLIGPDFVHRDGRWTTVREASLNPELSPDAATDRQADRLIRNAYRVLLTRSRTGIVLFSTDPETQEALRRLVPGRVSDHG